MTAPSESGLIALSHKKYRIVVILIIAVQAFSLPAVLAHQVVLSSVSQRLLLLTSGLHCAFPASSRGKAQASDCAATPTGCSAAPPVWVLASEHCGVVLSRSGPPAGNKLASSKANPILHPANSPRARCDEPVSVVVWAPRIQIVGHTCHTSGFDDMNACEPVHIS